MAEVGAGAISSSTLPVVTPACPVVGEYLVRVYAGGAFVGEAAASIGEEITALEVEGDGEVATADVGRGTPLGATFTGLADPVEGFEACVPEGFQVAERPMSATSTPSPPSASPTGRSASASTSTPGSLLDDQSPDELEELLVTTTVSGAETCPGRFLQGRDLAGPSSPSRGRRLGGVRVQVAAIWRRARTAPVARSC